MIRAGELGGRRGMSPAPGVTTARLEFQALLFRGGTNRSVRPSTGSGDALLGVDRERRLPGAGSLEVSR